MGTGLASAAPPGGRRRTRLGLADHAAFAVLLVPYLLLVHRFWFVTDDAYITFRYSRNFARGLGPIFNVGEVPPVEGYSNFLWMCLAALVERLGGNVELWPNVASTAVGVLFLYFVLRVLRTRLELSLPVSIGALALLATHPPFTVYSSSGLATMPFCFLMFVAFERLILRRGGIAPLGAGLALAALAMTRVSGLYWGVVLLGLAGVSRALARERVLAPLAKAFGVVLVIYGSYWLWRFSYYEQLFPNTVYAKAGLTAARLERGVDYVLVNLMTQLTLFVSFLGVPFALSRERRVIGLPIVAMALGPYAYAMLVTGDFMTFGRFLLPAFPFTVLLFAWALHDLVAGERRLLPQLLPAAAVAALFYPGIGPVWLAALVLVVWLALAWAGRKEARARQATAAALTVFAVWLGIQPAFDNHFVRRATRREHHFRWNSKQSAYRSEYDQWDLQCHNTARWGCLGRALRRWADPDAKIVHGAIGAVAYYSDLFLYDKNGLTCREVAMRDYVGGPLSSPGHDKTVELDFFLDDPRFEPTILKSRLLEGLPGVDDGFSEQLARQQFVGQVRGWETELRTLRLDDRFVTDFRPVPDWEYGGPGQYLVLWRKLRPEEDERAYRADLERRLLAFLEGEDPYRAVMEEGWPRALTEQVARRARPDDEDEGG